MPPKKKFDPDVWGPPPPLPARLPAPSSRSEAKPHPHHSKEPNSSPANAAVLPTSASSPSPAPSSSPSSAFQRHFANRSEVVGKDGSNAQLGVRAAAAAPGAPKGSLPAAAHRAEVAEKPKRKNASVPLKILAPGEAKEAAKAAEKAKHDAEEDKKRILAVAAAADASSASRPAPVIVKRQANKLPAIASVHRTLNFDAPAAAVAIKSNSDHNVVEVNIESSDSEQDGSCAPRQDTATPTSVSYAPRRSSSMTVQTPDQRVRCLVAPSALAAAAAGVNQRDSDKNYAVRPPPRSPTHGALQPLSAASTSLSCSTLTPLAKNVGACNPPLPATATADGAGAHHTRPIKEEKQPVPVRRATSTPSKAKPSCSVPSLGGHADLKTQKRRSSVSADLHSKSSSFPLQLKTEQKTGYTPYTLDSYKSLMADVAAQKAGGLGPSDTDAQRAARAKRERARAYGRQAEKLALQALANADTADAAAHEVRNGKGPELDTAQHKEEEALYSASVSSSSSSSYSSYSSSLTSRSSSSCGSVPAVKRQNNVCGRHAEDLKRRSVTPSKSSDAQAPTSPASKGQPEVNIEQAAPAKVKPRQTSLTTSPAGQSSSPAFTVTTVSRKEAKRARVRRERALAYAQKVAQERQEQLLKKLAENASNRNQENDDDDEANFIGSADGTSRDATATVEERMRQQRLMDLETAHAQMKAAVDRIRRQLRCGAGGKAENR
ncbi:hypothetical protein ABL78_0246 [Leptomonas seymouri]|uniref:Uncharacterized protein n=1 Tax=Leptomonas seymouri TaxID=5684 RepID=A0A0N1I935_LEPSE|nr:hypothetical protein ABL78_0246 [Leptomonas seymouri]|eukprot:KPI90650.1 hypothetical protein ABL78_0246 [Leptomonas seymouri]